MSDGQLYRGEKIPGDLRTYRRVHYLGGGDTMVVPRGYFFLRIAPVDDSGAMPRADETQKTTREEEQ